MSTERAEALKRIEAALDALELAGVRHRRELRLRLHVGEEELAALLFLAYHGVVAQRRLGATTGLSRSGAGAMIQRLEEQEYVRRWTDAHDRRLRLVELSDTGRAAIERATRRWSDHVKTSLAARSAEEIDALAGTLQAIAGDGGAPGADDPAQDDEGHPIWRRWG